MLSRSRGLLQGRRQFVDAVKVLLSSGSGGDGASIMSHEHGNELAGPGGGNGGNGGNVLLRCARRHSDLSHIKVMGSQLSALPGTCGFSKKSHGRRGRDLRLELPLGTQVIDVDTNEVLYDLDEDGLEVLLLEGGQGGKGNAAFANKWHHSPTESTRGLPGNTMLAQIELKTLADCGLVGYPNAGKSSLLSAISASKPTVAPYAFTTLRPYVGVLNDLYGNTCRVADIPGLIEGAYENRGLGHRFLRHVERTKALAFVVDMCDTYDPSPSASGRSLQPWDVIELLQDELEYYLPTLSERAIMVFANKMDVGVDAAGVPLARKLEELQHRVTLPVFPVSAAQGITLGPNHAETGLAPAVSFMCEEVFKLKTAEENARLRQRRSEERQLDRVFRSTNNGLFRKAPTRGTAREGEEEMSLVDQQLDFLGSSGLGDNFDGYEHSDAKGELHSYRDLTMRGKYWSVARDAGAATGSGSNS